jgi:hypothetical protein
VNRLREESVEDSRMNEIIPIEFIGGSQDGEIVDAMVVPDFFEVTVVDGVRGIYARESNEPPFIYVQIGYAENETWK